MHSAGIKRILRDNRSSARAIYRMRKARKQFQNSLVNRDFFRDSLSVISSGEAEFVALHWASSSNFGDALSKILVAELSRKKVVSAENFINLANQTVYSCIGSVLQYPQSSPFEVWGSGFIFGGARMLYRPAAVHAVRGRLSRQRLHELGVDCPPVFGDPAAIYFNKFLDKPRANAFKVGFIPHYVDKSNKAVAALEKDERVHVIDVFAPPDEVIKNCLECRYIASSSLHGLILADALEIPNAWVVLSSEVFKDGFKFKDYFSSVDRDGEDFLSEQNVSVETIVKRAHLRRKPLDLQRLILSCPFASDEGRNDALKLVVE